MVLNSKEGGGVAAGHQALPLRKQVGLRDWEDWWSSVSNKLVACGRQLTNLSCGGDHSTTKRTQFPGMRVLTIKVCDS